MTPSLTLPGGFLSIANHLWQSTLFAGIAGLLTLLLRNNRAHARYCLWLAASAKFLVPFSLLMLVGGLVGGLAGRHSVAVPAPTLVPVIVVAEVNEPFVPEVPPGAGAMPHPSKSGTWVVPTLVGVWAIGCGALLFSWWVRWRRMRVAVRAGSPAPLGIGVPTLSSASIIEPGVFGVFRPVLLLPDGIGDRLAPAELQAILAHELCHVRRRDNLATLIHMVVEAVFWFHPLVWWLGARLMDERERACDEEVLRMGSDAEAYAEGILKTCELYLQSPLKCVAGATGVNLSKRVEAIMANRTMLSLNLPKKVGLILAGILAVAIPVILGITHAPELRAQAQSVPKFEVASVRPSPPLQLPLVAPIRAGMSMDGGSVDMRLMSLRDLIIVAYRIRPYQLPGIPDWMTTEVFDIMATIPQGVVTTKAPEKQCGVIRPCNVFATAVPEMLRTLLAERFGLKIRRENKEMPVYALTVAKGGPKFKEVPPDDPEAEPVFPKPPEGGIVTGIGGMTDPLSVRIAPAGVRGDGSPVFDRRGNPTSESLHMEIPKATMARLANILTSMADRPVVDRTGLTGTYEIGFDAPSQGVWRAVMMPMPGKIPRAASPLESGAGGVMASDPTGDSIFKSVQSLGLRLERDKAAIETIVVEHIEKTPTEN
ncbi:MAG: TIGR03435 family protein [Bryobacterales bacterium]|nr:TIGR03435 family protein [Bryobacterales bacterium]